MLNILRSRALRSSAANSNAFCRNLYIRNSTRYLYNPRYSKQSTALLSRVINYEVQYHYVRRYGHLAGQQPNKPEDGKVSSKPGEQITPKKTPTPLDGVEGGKDLSVKEQRRKDWAIVKRLLVHIWPKDDWAARSRVVLGFALLLAGKVSGVLLSSH